MAARKGYVALFARRRGREALFELNKFLRGLGYQPSMDETALGNIGADAARRYRLTRRQPSQRPLPQLAVALGGDGTFIQHSSRYAPLGVPIVGVNFGRKGFLADIPQESMFKSIEAILAGKYSDEKRLMLDVSHMRAGKRVGEYVVVNDIVIDRGGAGKLINVEVSMDDRQRFTLRSDGVVISTPGGSTAYNMSAGGPIITPDADCIAFTPLNPYSLTQRPLVLSSGKALALTVRDGARLIPDGQKAPVLRRDDVVKVRAHRRRMVVRHPRGYDYFATLHDKLYWSQS